MISEKNCIVISYYDIQATLANQNPGGRGKGGEKNKSFPAADLFKVSGLYLSNYFRESNFKRNLNFLKMSTGFKIK